MYDGVDFPGIYSREAGDISNGDYIVINNRPCKVVNVSTSKTGTCHFVATDIFNGNELEDVVPSSHNCDVPRVNLTEYQLLKVSENGFLTLLSDFGEPRDDLKPPTDGILTLLKKAFALNKDLAVTVMSAMGEEQMCDARYFRLV